MATPIKPLSETTGYVANPVTDAPITTPAEMVSQNVGDVPPPASPAGTPSVQPIVPGEILPTPENKAEPRPLDVSSQLEAVDNAVAAMVELTKPAEEKNPAPEAEATVTTPTRGYNSVLRGINSAAYSSMSSIKIGKTAEPTRERVPNPRGYTPVLASQPVAPVIKQPASGVATGADVMDPNTATPNNAPKPARPDVSQRTIGAYIQQQMTATTAPGTFDELITKLQENPDSISLDPKQVNDRTSETSQYWNFGTFQGDALVIHHTAGRGDVDGVIQTFRERGYPAHFIIDRDGGITQVLGFDQKGQHTRPAQDGSGISNSNSWGVEIIARDDSDILPVQAEAAIKLAGFLNTQFGMPLDRVVGHGAINDHKQATEGATVTSLIRQLGGKNG